MENVEAANHNLPAPQGGNGNLVPEVITQRELEELAKEFGSKETAIKIVAYAEKFAGILPHPRIMAQYKTILPSAPDRLITMAETQQQHRIRLETSVIQGDVYRANLGLLLGFLLFAIFGVGAIILLGIGKSIEGYSLLATSLIGGIGNFIKVGRERAKEPSMPSAAKEANRKRRRKKR